jgi:hypothetical protein
MKLPMETLRPDSDSGKMPYMSHMPYLARIKQMSRSWSTLRYLVDWMQVGSDPWRWVHLKNDLDDRKERHNRTKVTFVEYQPDVAPASRLIEDRGELRELLEDRLKHEDTKPSPLRLFVVEDLSQQVIELLGSRFDIDPLFFREQITDTVWYNTRDPWAAPPSLSSSAKKRSWFRLRNLRLQYHTSTGGIKEAEKEAGHWNVKRRPDDDNNHWNYKDEKGATVSLLRTRTTIWIGKDTKHGKGTVGVILLDPSLKDGRPLWYGRTNWLPTTGLKSPELTGSWYEDILQMTLAFPWFEAVSGHKIEPQCLTCPTLFTVCAEWLVVCDYINARLSQVEWELERPEVFRSKGDVIESSLNRLLTWRRLLPVFREMVEETLEQSIPAAVRLTKLASKHDKEAEIFDDVREDYERVKRLLGELQNRVGRLSDHIDSELSIQNANQSLEENHSLARLSWLATIFIPATFIAGLFSMSNDLTAQLTTFKVYFSVALPTTALIMLFVWALNSKYWKDWRTKREKNKLEASAATEKSKLKSKG